MICRKERPVSELLQGKLRGLQKFYQNLTRSRVLKLRLFSAHAYQRVTDNQHFQTNLKTKQMKFLIFPSSATLRMYDFDITSENLNRKIKKV